MIKRHWGDLFSLPGFKRYFANTSWRLIGNVVRGVIMLVIGVYVVRYLGPNRFGLLSYATSFVALFSAVSTLGLDSIVIRELVKDEAGRNELLGTAFFLKLTGSFFLLAVLYVAIHFTSDDSFTNLLIFIIALSVVFQSFNVIDFYLQAKVLSKYVVYAKTVSLVIWAIVTLFLILVHASLLYFALVSLIESIVLAMGLVIVYFKQKLDIFHWRASIRQALALLKDSWPLMLSGVCILIYMRIDQVMIKQMLGTGAVGQYAAAVKLSEAWNFIPMIICSSLFPSILNAKTQSEEVYRSRLQKLYALMGWMAIAIALPMTFLSGWLVNLLYGGQYNQAASVLIIQTWTGIFTFLGVASSSWLVAENYTKISFFRTFTGMIVNVMLNIILIPRYGINGAAFATLISYAMAVFSIVFIKHTRKQAYMMIISVATLGMYKREGIY